MMARPLSEEKRQTLLQAAVDLVAQQGLSASTANIAKQAGVAAGTLFTYFGSKEDLLNQAYLQVKAEMAAALSATQEGDWQAQMRLWWHAYIDWGVRHPRERAAVRQLEYSPLLAEETRQQVREWFAPMWQMLSAAEQDGRFYLPLDLTVLMMEQMVEAVIQFPADDAAAQYRQMGFEMMWRALVRPQAA